MSGITEDEKKIVSHVTGKFGWHGGMGDPPDADTVLAIVRGTVEAIWLQREEERKRGNHG